MSRKAPTPPPYRPDNPGWEERGKNPNPPVYKRPTPPPVPPEPKK